MEKKIKIEDIIEMLKDASKSNPINITINFNNTVADGYDEDEGYDEELNNNEDWQPDEIYKEMWNKLKAIITYNMADEGAKVMMLQVMDYIERVS
jgi:hypothetical protein